MLLFEVPNRAKVRITSKRIYWAEGGAEKTIATDVTWEGVVTERYYVYKRIRRRLLIDHTIGFWTKYGIWQKDVECEVLFS